MGTRINFLKVPSATNTESQRWLCCLTILPQSFVIVGWLENLIRCKSNLECPPDILKKANRSSNVFASTHSPLSRHMLRHLLRVPRQLLHSHGRQCSNLVFGIYYRFHFILPRFFAIPPSTRNDLVNTLRAIIETRGREARVVVLYVACFVITKILMRTPGRSFSPPPPPAPPPTKRPPWIAYPFYNDVLLKSKL